MNPGTRIFAAFAMICLLAGAAGADTVVVNRLAYKDCTVVGMENGDLLFRTSSNNEVRKSMTDINKVEIAGQDDLNTAEGFYAAGKFEDAASAYDRVSSSKSFVSILVKYRRLRALNQTIQVDRASREWLRLIEETSVAPAVLAMRPTKMADKGSPANAAAISALEARSGSAKTDAEKSAINQVLLNLYQVEGQSGKARNVAQTIANIGGSDSGTGTGTSIGGAGLSGKAQALLLLIQSGKADQAVRDIKGNLNSYSGVELPTALYLLGTAQYALASTALGEEKNKLKTEAGVNFMRVAVFFRGSKEAPESLFMAGKICSELGNKAAAGQALQIVAESYPKTPWGSKARTILGDSRRAGASDSN